MKPPVGLDGPARVALRSLRLATLGQHQGRSSGSGRGLAPSDKTIADYLNSQGGRDGGLFREAPPGVPGTLSGGVELMVLR